ncbi:MAG: hypothetical protein WDO14_21985 [Bacteroidota bacterium]
MKLVYKKLFEVEIKHDYFLLPSEKYPLDYDISKTIGIAPTTGTEQLMKDYKIVFRETNTGFAVYIAAEQVGPTSYASVIDSDPKLVLSFKWTLANPHFLNFTNQRLKESDRNIYYFSNRSASQANGINYLSKTLTPSSSTYFGEPSYRLGDIISYNNETYELIEKDSPVNPFPANALKWVKLSTSVVNYVNPSDRLHWCTDFFRHERNNTIPGETIRYKLLNVDGNVVDLGVTVGTDQPQSEYRTPVAASDRVNNSVDLQHIPAGKYTMQINESAGISNDEFYLSHRSEATRLIGVSDLFVTGAAAPFQFISQDPATLRWILSPTPLKFLVRFHNRLTRWRYLKQDGTVFHQSPDPRPLTRRYSEYEIAVAAGTLKLPDPSVDSIIPEVDADLVKNIYSEIILSK